MRTIEVFSLMGSIFVDSGEAEKALDGTAQKAEGLGSKLKSGVGKAAKFGAGLAAGALTGAAALGGLVMKTTAVGDEIDKHSQKIGMSTTAYQEWDYVLGQNGISIDGMDRNMRKIDESMRKATDGVGESGAAYKSLGIDLEHTNGKAKNQEEVFGEVIEKLQGMDEGTERNALASELLGSKYAELNPLLNATAEETEALKEGLHEMGGVMSEDSVNAAAEFNDQMDDLKRGFGGVVREIGSAVMPMFSELVGWVTAHMPQIQSVMQTVFGAVQVVVKAAVSVFKNFLLPIFKTVVNWAKEHWPAVKVVIEQVFTAIQGVWENTLRPVMKKVLEVFKQVVEWVRSHWPQISSVFSEVFGIIQSVWNNVLKPVLDVLWTVLKNVLKWVSSNWPTISKIFGNVFGAIETVWNSVLKPVLEFVLELMGKIVTFVGGKIDGIQNVFGRVFGSIGRAVEKVTGFFGGFIKKIKSAWDWLTKWNKTDAKDKNPKYGGAGGGGRSRGGASQGSSYSGLPNVPYDRYAATLHKGEAVLTKRQNKKYKETKGLFADSGKSKGDITINLNNAEIHDTRDIKEIARDLAEQMKREVSFG